MDKNDDKNSTHFNFEKYGRKRTFNPYEQAWQFCSDVILDDTLNGSLEAGIEKYGIGFDWTEDDTKDFMKEGFTAGWHDAQHIMGSEGKTRFLLHCLLQSMKNENAEWYGTTLWRPIVMLEKVFDMVQTGKPYAYEVDVFKPFSLGGYEVTYKKDSRFIGDDRSYLTIQDETRNGVQFSPNEALQLLEWLQERKSFFLKEVSTKE